MGYGTRRPLTGVVSAVAALNVLAWGLYAVGSAGAVGLSGVGVLAFVLGTRHAFDADHIAVIDDCSRLAASQGRRRPGLGLSFALGHSAVVLILTVLVAWAARSVAGGDFERWRVVGGGLSTAFAAAFLLGAGGLNLRVLQQIRRAGPGASSTDPLSGGGLLTRLLGVRMQGSALAAWQLFPVGFLFGLGLETASEVALIGVTGSSAASGSASWATILALPLLFAAGMALCDTANSVMMSRLYDQTDGSTLRRRRFNIAMTALTASLGLVVGGIYLAKVLVDVVGMELLAPVAALTEHFEVLGYVIVVAYASIGVVTLTAGRRRSGALGAPAPAREPVIAS